MDQPSSVGDSNEFPNFGWALIKFVNVYVLRFHSENAPDRSNDTMADIALRVSYQFER
jgi:hypothetical protein